MKTIYYIGLILVLGSTGLSAQDYVSMQSKTKGLSAGVHVGYLSYTADQIHIETETGFGYGAELQYGFSHQFAVSAAFQHYSVTTQSIPNFDLPYNVDSPYPYLEIDLLAKFIFGSTNSKLRPNVTVGINYTRSEETYYDPIDDFISYQTFSGYSFCGGGGLQYFLSPQVSLDVAVLLLPGTFTQTLYNGVDLNFQHNFLTLRGLLGIAYHFQ